MIAVFVRQAPPSDIPPPKGPARHVCSPHFWRLQMLKTSRLAWKWPVSKLTRGGCGGQDPA